MHRFFASGLVVAALCAEPAQAQFQRSANISCAPRVGCTPCAPVGNCYSPCGFNNGGFGLFRPGCYPVGYYPSFLYYGGFYGGSDLYYGGFYGGSFIPGTGAAPAFTPTVLLTENVKDSNICRFTVRCPENAQLWFDGNLLADTGATRSFRTPQLNAQTKFNYTVACEWLGDNGQPVRMEQKIHFHPGDRLIVDFSNLQSVNLNSNRPSLTVSSP